ncbi:MAG TPA: chloride channel protein [Oribacterium sp.]|nr:chloride channel protein [Oribacterium sp.]
MAYWKTLPYKLLVGLKWIAFGILTGGIVGAVAALFAKGIVLATSFRLAHTWIVFFLPLAGLFIVWFYHRLGARKPRGTNLVLEAIREGERVPVRMAPLIIVSTVITHLFGGSAGREGAALQVGGSLGNGLGRLLHFRSEERRRTIMCGMSAAFSALFGTPLAATVLSMEISTVGVMYYSALVPCAVAALTAHFVAQAINPGSEAMLLSVVPTFHVREAVCTMLFAGACAMVSVLFATSMHRSKKLLQKAFPNDYLRVAVSGVLIVLLTLLVGSQTYNGTGSQIIAACIENPAVAIPFYAFLLKILFTSITLGGGFQGGEIVPSLFIGASFGHVVGSFTGMDPALSSAIGMACVFCGVTNCPLASLLIAFEMFGFEASSYFILAIAITYLFSGNYGIYGAQKIRFSKWDPKEIDANTH